MCYSDATQKLVCTTTRERYIRGTIMKRSISLTIAVLLIASLLVTPALASTVVTTPNGTWTAYPGQATSYQA